MTDKVMGSDEFFGLIEEFLSPRMAELGYHGIGGSENDQPQSRGMLTRLGARSHGADFPGRAPFLRYDFGFEAGSTDVRRLLNPDDPESADEIWLSYEPVTEELDLSAWHSIAEGRVDWDPRSDTGPCSRSELRRRLEEIGRAVADFARSQGGPPSTSSHAGVQSRNSEVEAAQSRWSRYWRPAFMAWMRNSLPLSERSTTTSRSRPVERHG